MESTQLTVAQFGVLSEIAQHGPCPQRELAKKSGVSLGTVNAAIRELRDAGALGVKGVITEEGFRLLEPYRVENAIIMAAGMSTRFAPISYERPKGALRVRGEVLIERQIRQLQEAGIHDITVVVGYMKEQFFYLEDEFGVKIRVNEEYAQRNNNSTLMLVRAELGNTYICSSDNYFTENVFEPYVYRAYYAASFFEGATDEYLLETGGHGVITAVRHGGEDAYGMLGHAYFDRKFSRAFTHILETEYDLPETAPKLWEDIFADHVRELPMVMRTYAPGVVYEFDSLDELGEFDPTFIENIDSSILDNICTTLKTVRSDVRGIEPISQGLTNLSFKFVVGDELYVYRHPGAGTDAIINRAAETEVQKIARDLGLDDTFIYEDPQQGWKISHYLPDCVELDYHNAEQVGQALAMIRALHASGAQSDFSFDVYAKTLEIEGLLGERQRASFPDFKNLHELVAGLASFVKKEAGVPCLCHNDFYSPNLLFSGGKAYLIDWEYSGMSDYASDLGTFVCCSDYGLEEALEVLDCYFGRPATPGERAHCLSYIAISSYYWFVWALYKDACGSPVGEWLYLWYRNAKQFGQHALEAIGAINPSL